ncbi:MAG TPA: DUF433 domain-containing protein [Gemmataceae bacterium]|jgi:uncharacterized protein (DUF433 family)
MNWQDRITANPSVLAGKPVIKGTRLAIEFLVELLAENRSHEQILSNYPQLAEEDIQAALRYAVEAAPGRADFEKYLTAVPNVAPPEDDRLD